MEHENFGLKPGEIYFDSAATTLKPKQVSDALIEYYTKGSASVHRSVYERGVRATEQYEKSRQRVKEFIGADRGDEIVFVKSATEAINLLSYSLTDLCLKSGDEVIVSVAEHHSNFVPWQEACKRVGAKFTIIGLDSNYQIDLQELKQTISCKTKIVALNHISNVLGVKNPIQEVSKICRMFGSYLVVDGAQSVCHEKIDVKMLGADFFVFSGHKMYGPTGIGVLWGKEKLLDAMKPFHFGGSMVEEVGDISTSYQSGAQKFEAGTPPIGSAIALYEAIEFVDKNREQLHKQKELTSYAKQALQKVFSSDVIIFGGQNTIVSFVIKKMHALDVATLLALDGICVRAGNHCAAPLLRYLKQSSILRFSFGLYNTHKEIDTVIAKMQELVYCLDTK